MTNCDPGAANQDVILSPSLQLDMLSVKVEFSKATIFPLVMMAFVEGNGSISIEKDGNIMTSFARSLN